MHVEDVAQAIIADLKTNAPPDQALNVGSGVRTSVADIAAGKAFGASPDRVVTGQYRLGDIRHNYADISPLRDVLGYVPRIGLAEGLKRFAT